MSLKLGTSYDKDYRKYEGVAKRIKAMADIIEYLGPKKFNECHAELLDFTRAHGEVPHYMLFVMAGIQWYPVRAWQETICIELGWKYVAHDDFTIRVVPRNKAEVIKFKIVE